MLIFYAEYFIYYVNFIVLLSSEMQDFNQH